MKDSELLDYVDREQWALTPIIGGGYVVEANEATGGDDYQVVELGRGPSIRQAILSAIHAV